MFMTPIDPTITLMTLLASFAMADHDVDICYEGINTSTSDIVRYRDRDKITFTIGVDVDPIQFICRPRNDTQRYFASVSTCGEVSNFNGSSVNINETGCDRNCHSYVITPVYVECIILKCERDTINSNSTKECHVYININEASPSQITASVNTRSLGSANETEVSTVVAICAVIAAIIIFGLMIYSCCKGLQHKRRSYDIEDQSRPPDILSDPVQKVVSYKNDKQSDGIQGIDCTNSTEVTLRNELLKVANPENEESDTTDLITSTRSKRIAPHCKVQRGYEIRSYEEGIMQESIVSASILFGGVNEESVEVHTLHHAQETDGNSSAFCFNTTNGKLHHPYGNVNPKVKTVLHDNEMMNYTALKLVCTK